MIRQTPAIERTPPRIFCTGLFLFSFLFLLVAHLWAGQDRPNWKAEWEATLKAAEREGRVVIYGPTGRGQQMLYTDVFQKAFPKIRVNYTPGRISEIISRIMAEQRAGIRQVDLVLGGTDLLLGALKEKGLLQPIRPLLILPELLDTTAWFKGKLWFADSEDKYVLMWRAVPYVSACVNSNVIKPNELKSYWDLLDPKWKGKIVSQDLRIGSARNQMYGVYIRQDLGPKYLKRLFGEMDIMVSRSLPQISDWVASGKFAIALGGVDCEAMTAKGLPVAPIFLEGLAAVGAGSDPAALLASAPNTSAAKVFLNWILTREGQMAFQKLTKENSFRVDIPKEGIVEPAFVLDPKRDYIFTGLEEYKNKINEFRPWLESLIQSKCTGRCD
jgi:iron(III) transport system substrate-binding protein